MEGKIALPPYRFGAFGGKQIFAIAVAAHDRTLHGAQHLPALGLHPSRDIGDRGFTKRVVLNDTAAPYSARSTSN
jgi:hypothetical protein